MGSLAEARPRAKYLADVLKALAHPARLRIVAALCEGEESVIGLAGRLGMPDDEITYSFVAGTTDGVGHWNRATNRWRAFRTTDVIPGSTVTASVRTSAAGSTRTLSSLLFIGF